MDEQQTSLSTGSSEEMIPSQESVLYEESFASEDASLPPEESTTLPEDVVEKHGPCISVDKSVYETNETITVAFSETDHKDWVGFYPYGAEPGTMNSIVWQYAVGEGKLTFNASSLRGAGDFWVFLCDNDGYEVLDMLTITLQDSDKTDYGATAIELEVSVDDGYSRAKATITPSSAKTLTYQLYWSKGGRRLEGYLPLYSVTHSGKDPFTVSLNDCLFMPAEADGVELAVKEGNSASLFADADKAWKLTPSVLKYKFAVVTDLHITPGRPAHASHLKQALKDMQGYGGLSAIFTVGDNTDRGKPEEYDLLLSIVEEAGELPPIYYAMGNHDMVYNGTYDSQVALFAQRTGMPGAYYSADLQGTRFIVLGSDAAVGEGVIYRRQLDWLKAELQKTDKDIPVFLFLHQPLIETVSGSLASVDKEIQDWYGVADAATEIRAILKEYPNAVLFTGHTHWTLESLQPFLPGKGKDANFMNGASVGYLWTDEDTSTGGSEGLYVEVYEDYILIRGREFVQGKWCAAAQFVIPITKA